MTALVHPAWCRPDLCDQSSPSVDVVHRSKPRTWGAHGDSQPARATVELVKSDEHRPGPGETDSYYPTQVRMVVWTENFEGEIGFTIDAEDARRLGHLLIDLAAIANATPIAPHPSAVRRAEAKEAHT